MKQPHQCEIIQSISSNQVFLGVEVLDAGWNHFYVPLPSSGPDFQPSEYFSIADGGEAVVIFKVIVLLLDVPSDGNVPYES